MQQIPLTSTIVIITHNRKEELRVALASVVDQDVHCDVLVIDDASTDGTPEMVRAEFPSVRLEVVPTAQGYVVHRNAAARWVTTDIIISIDDDAEMRSPSTVRQILEAFGDPKVAVVAFPFINVNIAPDVVSHRIPDEKDVYCVREFAGTAYAVRRDVFLKLGGYKDTLFHMSEESDFAIRLLDAGYVVRAATGDPIFHYTSPKRVISRVFIYRARNRVLWSWWYVPFPHLFLDLLAAIWNLLRASRGLREQAWTLRGITRGFGAVLSGLYARTPVSRATYRAWHVLKGRHVKLSDLEPLLHPLPAR